MMRGCTRSEGINELKSHIVGQRIESWGEIL